ncbi:helix-turn-helix transcriptional regulator [Candidatus Contubernalis alkalaceticus]|nr:helix-turn-helix transcriptional regulator [Candidatus Contubernalis alkalaceticus]UNC92991.1 helix-turn-helix transcriptional regulator [Candidatus Contubernalis alkalaceticus]
MVKVDLTERQAKIIEIVKRNGPISGEDIASQLELSRAALRPHLSVLTMSGHLEARPRVGYYYTGKTENSLVTKALRKIKVKDVKRMPVVVKEDVSVYDAAVSLILEDTGTIYVVGEDGYLAGVVSRKDFLKSCIGGTTTRSMPVGFIMTRMPNIITTEPEEDVLDAAKKIMEYQVDSLPVVREEKNGKLKILGRFTKTSITGLMIELCGEM